MNRVSQLRPKDMTYLLALFTHKSELDLRSPADVANARHYYNPLSLISHLRSVLTCDQLRFESQLPSGNILASAQGLARLAAFMANKGSLGDREMISFPTWKAMHSDTVQR